MNGQSYDTLNWARIRHLLKLGIIAALMVLIGDMLLGWGVHDASKGGMEGFLSAYLDLPDSRIFWSAFLGLIGIPLETLCYFAVYRLIKPYSEKYAHLYRSGILGILACVFFYKHMMAASPDTAMDLSIRFGLYFLLPGMILFFIFWVVHHIAHIGVFAKGLTPYPKWCWIFCPALGMALTMLLKLFPETELRNAITAGWISIGSLWMFIGLLILSRKAEQYAQKGRKRA